MSILKPYRLNVTAFDALCAAGAFRDRKVELLKGLLIMMTSGPAHDLAVTAVAEALRGRLDKAAWTVREEKPIVLSPRWKPLPDVAVVRGHYRDYVRTPTAADVALLIEVSDSTYLKDSRFKRRWYAKLGVPAYWIVDLNRRLVEVYAGGGLDLVATWAEGAAAPFELDGRGFGEIPVADLLP